MGYFGEKLRQQRERRGLSLDAISATTKISIRMLRAIEDEHFDQLPGGVFNKGFVRAYARQVGINEDEAVTDYLAALRESQIQSQAILPNLRPAAVRSPDPASNAPRNQNSGQAQDGTTPLGANNEPHSSNENRRANQDRRIEPRRRDDREAPPLADLHAAPAEPRSVEHPLEENIGEEIPSQPPAFQNVSSPSDSGDPDFPAESIPSADSTSPVRWGRLAIPLLLIALALAFWTLHRRNRSASASEPAPPSVASATAVTPPAVVAPAATTSTAASSLAPTLALPPATTATHTSAPSDPNAIPVVHSQPQVDKPKPPPTFTLTIRAAQTSWVAITADGQPVARETLFAPAHTSVRASHEIVVRAGNAAAISFLLNQHEIPAQGAEGEVRTYTFDATGLRDSSPAQPAPATR